MISRRTGRRPSRRRCWRCHRRRRPQHPRLRRNVEGLYLLEHLGVLAHAHEVGRREARVLGAIGIQHLQVMQAIGVAVRQRLEQHAVHDAENGAIGADAERERQQRRRGKRRRAAQHAEGVADVLPEFGKKLCSLHVSFPSLVDGDALLSRAVVITESFERQPARPLRAFALLDQLAHPHLDMKGQLGLDVSGRFEAEEPPEARPLRHRLATSAPARQVRRTPRRHSGASDRFRRATARGRCG